MIVIGKYQYKPVANPTYLAKLNNIMQWSGKEDKHEFYSIKRENGSLNLLESHLKVLERIARHDIQKNKSMPKNIRRNLQRKSRKINMIEKIGQSLYNQGVNDYHHGGANQQGGGPQAITLASSKKFVTSFLELIQSDFPEKKEIRILWVYSSFHIHLIFNQIGIGLAEEAILLCAAFRQLHYSISILGLELSYENSRKAKELIEKYEMRNYIQVYHYDFIFYQSRNETFDMCYTTAAVNSIFIEKLLYISIQCKIKYIFASEAILPKPLPAPFYHNLFVKDIYLCGSHSARPIHRIQMYEEQIEEEKQNLLSNFRTNICREFQRNVASYLDSGKIYFSWNQRNSIEITIEDILSDKDTYLYSFSWIPFQFQRGQNSRYDADFDSGVLNIELKQRILTSFVDQYQENFDIPKQVVYPDFTS